MRKLEYYGDGAQISQHLQGKQIECFMQDGQWLIIRCTDGHEARVGWQDAAGNQLRGAPFLENLDVKIAIAGIGLGSTLAEL